MAVVGLADKCLECLVPRMVDRVLQQYCPVRDYMDSAVRFVRQDGAASRGDAKEGRQLASHCCDARVVRVNKARSEWAH